MSLADYLPHGSTIVLIDEILEFKQGDIVKCREKDGDLYAFELL